MRPIRLRLLMGLLLAPRAASAETVDGSGALALAGLLGIVSPLLGAQEKDVLNKLLDGQADFTFSKGKTISVEAAQVACKAGNVDIKSHSCDLSFGKLNVALKGRAALELYGHADRKSACRRCRRWFGVRDDRRARLQIDPTR